MQNERIGELRPFGGREQRAQLAFDLLGVVAVRQPDPAGDTQDVPVHWKPRDLERMPEHDVGGLPANARQRGQGVHLRRIGRAHV